MKSSTLKSFLWRIIREAVRRPRVVKTHAMGRDREFRAYDLGADTFVFQHGVWKELGGHASVLLVDKQDLKRGERGHVMTVTTGNHAVAAVPLLKGELWDLAEVPAEKRTDAMLHCILCANAVDGKLEISQRDVLLDKLVALDKWLVRGLGFSLADVVFVDRIGTTRDYFRTLGEDWRFRPLAWTARDMALVLAASRKRISTGLCYYHGSRGVHFLTYPEFHAFAQRAASDFDRFRDELHELAGTFEGAATSFMRQDKVHGHHEIELFGLARGVALRQFVPALEALWADVDAGRVGREEASARALSLDASYKSLLTHPAFADGTSAEFTERLYVYVTGEIYALEGEGSTPAFDDRRAALPGAWFDAGKVCLHPGADRRTQQLLALLHQLSSSDEIVEWANVYELHGDEDVPLGKGATREVVYKTAYSPVPRGIVEKRLSATGKDYGAYVMCRVEGLKALGMSLPRYRLVSSRLGRDGKSATSYYVRTRCEGHPLDHVPAHCFRRFGDKGADDAAVVLAFAALMGDAAAQNAAMKKYDPEKKSPLFDAGKELYAFAWDVRRERSMPQSVSICSVRGSYGWPDLSETDANFAAVSAFYADAHFRALKHFADAHPAVDPVAIAQRFCDGYENRTRAMTRSYVVRRDVFNAFSPPLAAHWGFPAKWRFLLWALERQCAALPEFRAGFLKKSG